MPKVIVFNISLVGEDSLCAYARGSNVQALFQTKEARQAHGEIEVYEARSSEEVGKILSGNPSVPVVVVSGGGASILEVMEEVLPLARKYELTHFVLLNYLNQADRIVFPGVRSGMQISDLTLCLYCFGAAPSEKIFGKPGTEGGLKAPVSSGKGLCSSNLSRGRMGYNSALLDF